MPKNKRISTINLYSLHIPILALAVLVFVGVVAFNNYADNENTGDVLSEKSEKKEKKEKPNKPDAASASTKSNSNAQLHKKTVAEIVTTLEEVATTEEEQGNIEVSEEIEEVTTEIEQDQEEIVEVIEKVESRPKWQTLLVGTDYKNLGQLRSQLVKNRNTIRKLSKTSADVTAPAAAELVQTQIDTLEEEQFRIKEIIEENEQQFSLLGWVFKFLSGYNSGDTDNEVDESTESLGN